MVGNPFTAVGLYIRSGQLQLPLSSVVEEFKAAKCRVQSRDSQDEQVKHAGVMTRSGRKWAADQLSHDSSVAQAERMLKLRDITGAPCRKTGSWNLSFPTVEEGRNQ